MVLHEPAEGGVAVPRPNDSYRSPASRRETAVIRHPARERGIMPSTTPPVGVTIAIASPAFTPVWAQSSRISMRQSLRRIELRPSSPGSPPNAPEFQHGAMAVTALLSPACAHVGLTRP